MSIDFDYVRAHGIDIAREIFLILYNKSIEGFRVLLPNEFRDSEIEHCSWWLFFDKIYLPVPPAKDVPTMISPVTGIIGIPNGVATLGSIIHDFIQRELIKKFGNEIIKAERLTQVKFNIDNGTTLVISGHVDIDYPRAGAIPSLADIKSMGEDTFKKIVGLLPCGEDEYAAHKVAMTQGQTNAYAIQSNLEGKEFDVILMSQKDLQFKVETHVAEKKSFSDNLVKLINILEAVKAFQAGNEDARPRPAGVMACEICPHFNTHCLGKEAVLGGQTTIEHFMK